MKFRTILASTKVQEIDKNAVSQVLYGVPRGPFANPPKTIATLLIFAIGIITLIIKRKSSWKVKAIIVIVTLIGIFIALKINWSELFGTGLI